MHALPLLLALASAATAGSPPLENWTLERSLTLQGETHHVQGIVVVDGTLLVSSVDAARKKGFLMVFDLASGKRLKEVEIGSGAMFHPGGMDSDGTSLWVPVAEYKPGSRSLIERRALATLELLSRFEVADHIGCLSIAGDHLVGGNWDARQFYEWSFEGTLMRRRDNPNRTHYQDVKMRYGTLVASGMAPDAVEWLDPETLAPLERAGAGKTDRGAAYTREGMDFRDGRLYLLPEDSQSRLFVFRRESE